METYVNRIDAWRVVDGDTVEVWLDPGFDITLKMYCRINDVDCPERHTEAGKWVTRCVEAWLIEHAGEQLWASSYEKGKYAGRFIGDIHTMEYGGPKSTLSGFILREELEKKWCKVDDKQIIKNAKTYLGL